MTYSTEIQVLPTADKFTLLLSDIIYCACLSSQLHYTVSWKTEVPSI